MEYTKILSEHFCQAAVLALRDTAIEFETSNHVIYEYPPKNPNIDSVGVWQAKNPFNEHRSVMKAALPLVHPDAYRIFFPFSYLWGLIENIIDPPGTREAAWVDFWESSFGEILLLCIFGLIVSGIAIAVMKIIECF